LLLALIKTSFASISCNRLDLEAILARGLTQRNVIKILQVGL
jgi:hypothetical protein